MASNQNWEGPFRALQFAIVEDKDSYAMIKIEKEGLDLTKLEFNITFVGSELRVRTKEGSALYGFNYEVKGPIDTSNLSGGLKKKSKHATLRITKNEKFKF